MAKATTIRGLSAKASMQEVGPRILDARLRDVQQYEPGLPEMDAVHDARVAVRRLRAALRLLRLGALDAPVKKLQDALGAVRDLQLQIEWLTGRDDALAARRKALLARVEARLVHAVGAWRLQTLPRLLEAGTGTFKGEFADKTRKLLRKRLDRFEERLDLVLERPAAAAMHAVRRSVKQLRYLFELVQPALPLVSKSMLAELTPLQEALGELRDVDVRVELLRDPALLRAQREDRERLAKIVTTALARWKKQKLAPRARRALS